MSSAQSETITSPTTAEPVAKPVPLRVRPNHVSRQTVSDFVWDGLATLGALATLALLLLLVGSLIYGGWPAIKTFGVEFLWGTDWDYDSETYGALGVIYGTLVTSALALLFAVPLAIGGALFLVKVAPQWLAKPASFLIELLAAIPSITYGFWGIVVLIPFLRDGYSYTNDAGDVVQVVPPIMNTLAYWTQNIPGLGTLFGSSLMIDDKPFVIFGNTLFAAGLVLAIMILPIITAVTRDVLETVPRNIEEGAYGLGATWWQTMLMMLNYGKAGILGAIVLGLARALGETMAVAMTVGNNNRAFADGVQNEDFSLFSPGQTMAGLLANEFPNQTSQFHGQTMIYIALVLLVIAVLVNLAARALVLRVAHQGSRV